MLPGWSRCHAGSELQDLSFYGSGSCDVRGHAHPQEKKEKCVTARSDVRLLCPCKNSPSDDFSLMKNRCSGNLSHVFILQHLLNRKRFFLGDTPDVSVSELLPSPQAQQPPTRGRGRKTCGGVSSTAGCRKRGWRKRCSRMQRLSDLNHLWHFQVLMMSKTKKTRVKVYQRNAVKWGEPRA